MKQALRQLNKEHYSDILSRVEDVEVKMHKAERELMLDLRNGEVRRKDVEAAKEYAHLKRDGESFLRQKSRIHWLKRGRGQQL